MYILRPDEKTTPVMLYTKESVVRGEVVTKEIVHRVNIWPRTDGVPKYMHLLKAQIVVFGGGPGRTLSYPELYFPSAELIAFHTLPPTDEPLDYEPAEANRMMVDLDVIAGTFLMKGKIRISTHSEIGVSLEMARVAWMSLYDVVISNLYLAQMPPLSVPLVLVNPAHIAFGIPEPK
jgi:hypothetical protein